MKKIILILAFLACLLNLQHASACTISEDILESVPLNYAGIPNDYRLKLVDMMLNAQRWPDVEIQAQIIASAYAGEKNASELAKSRGKQLKDFLVQIGIKPQYIYTDTHIVRTPYPLDSTGHSGYLQLGVSLMPLCKGSCAWLCDDPRVKPTSRAIK
ncbi:hypothetical protein G3O06_07810 [Burkholderia sp. Ac-20345]|uniref:hypothetical protein n=1 Tax=Burkholderia sp. Ac-20345 TaxID=2703891 RepID=UPI00197C5A2F|nr:hypothetical protein [Burkholderia sp. Ac-20345]MBN3777456.1 hypothetical protein [Burkholderia sp. Ac-20345]